MAEIEDDGFVTVHHSNYVATQGTRRELIEKGIILARVQHLKRGSTYTILGRGKVQTEAPLQDYAEVVIYQSEADGSIWARPVDEFFDGRFLTLTGAETESDEIASWKMAADEAERECKALREKVGALEKAFSEQVAARTNAELRRVYAEVRSAQLDAALQPFANAADEADEYDYEDETQAPVYCGQCRAARAAMEGKP